ncbi:uridine 5'-monophosphate synthase [Trichonephila clavata]|uniref:orotate phosphoribosyltransferase n=1 Tax=Trichonephila clavata TaxID=2740835 RepID=A0A8X6I1H0_TRICU|nr:uridine 5'-monophosphate synthase [Trichonephila clavata]
MDTFKLGHFHLQTGPISPFYIDLRHITCHPKVFNAVSEAIYLKMVNLNLKADTVCGVPYTALPIASYLCSHHEIPMLIKRKERKDYGTKKMVEGIINPGETCLVIEDVVVSGASIIDTVADLREEGLVVTDCITILDRLQGGEENLRKNFFFLYGSLAHQRRPINVAVIAGPRPGTQTSEGHYPVELAVWKTDGHVYTCQYSLDVIVKKCKDVFPPTDGSVNCSHGTVWGSKCSFFCSTNYELQGHRTVTCEEHSTEMTWSSSFPKCKKISYKYILSSKNLPCLKPPKPSDGAVLCDLKDQSMYPDGTVCQFFCYPGYLIENLLTSSTLIVCKNGQWTPNSDVQCIATYCSEPQHPEYGSTRCDNKAAKETVMKSKYENGTTCHFKCDVGYTIPKSQQHLAKITCHAPYWNDSSIPECKQRILPQPYARDCKNVTLTANRRGHAKLRPPRFYLKNSVSANRILYGKCTYSGKISVGVYINHCSAYNRELNTTGHCTYGIIVKESSCPPLPTVAHSQLHCDNDGSRSYPKYTLCKYVCDNGFIIPLKQKKFQLKTCTSKLKWKPAATPYCKRSIPPKLKRGSCISQTLILKNSTSAKIKLPRFKSSLKGSKVKVKCTLNGTLPVGQYINKCEAIDKQLGLKSFCFFNIAVQAIGCPELPVVSPLFSKCSSIKNGEYFPIGTLCNYTCEDGYVIPTSLLSNSVKLCTAHEQWNSSVVPICVYQSPPVPEDAPCFNHSASVEDLKVLQIPVPKFKSFNEEDVEVICSPQNLTEYGVHKINCSAFDPELRVNGYCSFEFEILKANSIAELSREALLGCFELPFIPSGSINCSNSKDEELYPIETICSYECDEGYVIPTSFLTNSVKVCVAHEHWNNTMSPNCTYQSPPVPEPDFCLDHSVIVEDFSTFQYGAPQFKSSTGIIIEANCLPQNITEYIVYNISCTAFDPELRIHGSCTFELDVQTPNNVAEFAGEEISCPYPEKMEQGSVHCTSTNSKLYSVGTVCKITCYEGFTLSPSQKENEYFICLSTGDWNVSSTPNCLKSKSPVLISGCEDYVLNIPDLSLINLSVPIFFDSQNASASVNCMPEVFQKYGKHEILCTAQDEQFNTSASCKFNIDIIKEHLEVETNDTTIEYSSTTTKAPLIPCKALEPPHKGSLNCTSDSIEYCNISCEDGYEFSSAFDMLNLERIECDGKDGLWDFERLYNFHSLPECLGRLQNTSVEVLLSFTAYVEHCGEEYELELQSEIKNLLVAMNQETCHIVNCESFNITCSEVPSSNRHLINNTWILKAAFDPSEYMDSDEVPDAEINIETIVDIIQKEVNYEGQLKKDLLDIGVELKLNSYLQSHFFLVCEKDGYAVNERTNRCVECPPGTMEKNGRSFILDWKCTSNMFSLISLLLFLKK